MRIIDRFALGFIHPKFSLAICMARFISEGSDSVEPVPEEVLVSAPRGKCRFLAVHPEGADCQWRKIHPESCRLIRKLTSGLCG